MIKFEGITKVYNDGFRAVDDLNLHVKEGELLVLIGPSGCGKTTTMKMINRLIEPSEGQILVEGEEISKKDPVELRRNIGYVIQHIGLLPNMTIGENVALVPILKKWDKAKYIKRVDELLEMVGLDPDIHRNRYPAELSGGQKQRVGVIRALAADPPIILMDEPFSALDPISREQLQDELIKLQEEIKKTIVFVTHDIDEALKIASRICIMKQGKIVQLNDPEYILRHPINDFVRNFIGEERLSKSKFLPSLSEVLVKPVTAGPNRGLAEAVKIMHDRKVDSLLVVDKNDKLLGFVSVWEIQPHYHEEDLKLKDIMKKDIPVIQSNQSLIEAIKVSSERHVRFVPVVTDSYQLIGVITRASLVDVMAGKYGDVI